MPRMPTPEPFRPPPPSLPANQWQAVFSQGQAQAIDTLRRASLRHSDPAATDPIWHATLRSTTEFQYRAEFWAEQYGHLSSDERSARIAADIRAGVSHGVQNFYRPGQKYVRFRMLEHRLRAANECISDAHALVAEAQARVDYLWEIDDVAAARVRVAEAEVVLADAQACRERRFRRMNRWLAGEGDEVDTPPNEISDPLAVGDGLRLSSNDGSHLHMHLPLETPRCTRRYRPS
ncbi:hypothetical protein NX059_001201 [Plenodomus lindquistii]|nr:hypothetical protein NX059_001201 [Plenodomus lindquistii]